MSYDKLESEELLRLAVAAMNNNQDADALVMLKTLLEREPRHRMARYLLAAQHAQLGMFDQAESGFREVAGQAPDLPMARFQLAQLLLTKGNNAEATEVLASLTSRSDALGGYARGLAALASEDGGRAAAELTAALHLEQEVPALASDMRALLARLQEAVGEAPADPAAAPIFLTGYRQGSRAD